MTGGLRPLTHSGPGTGARELIDGLGLREPGRNRERPRLVAAMIESIDGRAAVHGRSVGLGHPDDRALLRGLREGAQLVLCEGGPRLLRAFASDGLLDDLILTVAPLLVAGGAPGPLTGGPLDPPVCLRLQAVWRAEDHAFLHYAA